MRYYDYAQDIERQTKLKKVLQTFLKRRGINVPLSEIQPSGAMWYEGEFKVGERFYQVNDLKVHRYGESWFECHDYEDIKGFRVSSGYYLTGLSNSQRSLYIGSEHVYTFNPRVAEYNKMPEKRLNWLAHTYLDEYIKAGKPGNADLDVLLKTIKYELGKLYLKRWYDYLK